MKRKHHSKTEKKGAQPSQYRWALTAFSMAVVLSAILSLASESVLGSAGMAVAVLILLAFILLGIAFDIVGMAVAAADPKPFHSMAAHKVKGAKESLMLLRNAGAVSSVCNDVVGDICGIVSGTTAAVIVVHLHAILEVPALFLSVAATALISGLTIGGKALGKNFAIKCSTRVVFMVGRALSLFRR